ncbi:MAG: Ni/Fe hydrogenase subunit alpha [Anaerolineaceae bacterium]|jgi:F420-non-reducing hydrogenase large subunit|nr:Ni/Fe hydrogenase subunit alpha [Anaerolineaceae bacterium]
MTTLTFPISRIEGHARVVIEVQAGEVVSARFQATEMRGFQKFVQGVPAEQMPVITPRICGVCSTAHHVAAVKALEDAYGITPPPLAKKIRNLLLLGQLIQNQATSLFIFTMPDRVGVDSIFHMSQEEASSETQFNIAQCALRVRKIGTDLITLAGGQFIHPVKAVIGGVTSGIEPEKAEAMRQRMLKLLPRACALVDEYWELSAQMRDRIGSWGDDQPAYYIASTGETKPDLDTDSIRIMEPGGRIVENFQPKDFRKFLNYEDTIYSYAGQSSFQGKVLRANSLARMNMIKSLATPLADDYLQRLEAEYGKPAHPILLFDLCRGIELVYAFERAIEILSEPLDNEDTDSPYTPRDGEGYGLVEAPRGPLIHHYAIQKGKITSAEFIIPTVHNMLAIERALKVAARRYVNSEQINLELEKAVGRVVRAFDPCIACATQ